MPFNIRFLLYLILLNFILFKQTHAQNNSSNTCSYNNYYEAAEKEYGINQELLNGVYFEDLYYHALGHPYHLSDTFKTGSLIYRGKEYNNVLLKYEIHSQQLLASYSNNSDSVVFYIQKEFVSEFQIGNRKYISVALNADNAKSFYQVIGDEYPIKIFYAWEKFRSNSEHYVLPSFKFSPDRKKSYIFLQNEMVRFKGKNSFVRKFSSKDQAAIKKYIRENRIKIKHGSNNDMELLMKFINAIKKA